MAPKTSCGRADVDGDIAVCHAFEARGHFVQSLRRAYRFRYALGSASDIAQGSCDACRIVRTFLEPRLQVSRHVFGLA
jgi:hypothetical protein